MRRRLAPLARQLAALLALATGPAGFLLDGECVIRHIHPDSGGCYVAGDAAHAALESAIEELFGEVAGG